MPIVYCLHHVYYVYAQIPEKRYLIFFRWQIPILRLSLVTQGSKTSKAVFSPPYVTLQRKNKANFVSLIRPVV